MGRPSPVEGGIEDRLAEGFRSAPPAWPRCYGGPLRINDPGGDRREQARIEMMKAADSRHSLAISTDVGNRRFEVEEEQYSPLSGDRVSYLHCFETGEEVVRFLLQMIGTHIALRQSVAEKLA
jgi:hypothetical protein